MKTITKLFALLILCMIINTSYSQTSLSAGAGEFYSFKQGEASTYKTAIISQVNQLFGNVILSAITVGVMDSVAKAYIGTGLSVGVYQSKDATQNIIIGVNALKGEGKEALLGASATLKQNNTLISLCFNRDINKSTNWIGLTLQQIVLK